MKSQVLKKIISKLPDAPGVYMFLARRGGGKRGNKILYIGKATSLKDRVRSYFNGDVINTRGPLIAKMLEKHTKVEYIKTDSVLEAIILEAYLIKKHQPEANTIDKDDKSFNYVVITEEDFPRVLTVRGRELQTNYNTSSSSTRLNLVGFKGCPWNPRDALGYNIGYTFGPFTNGGQLKEALKLVRKIFPYRDRCVPFSESAHSKVRPLQPNSLRSNLGKSEAGCFNRQIGLCPGVCTGEISKKEYAKQIRNIVLFFEGRKKQLVKNFEKQMKAFSNSQEFEKSNIAKKTLFSLKHIQDVALIKKEKNFLLVSHNSEFVAHPFRIESYDIAHMAGQNVVGVMTVVEDGEVKKSDYRKFKIKWFDSLDKLGTRGLTMGNNISHGVNDTKSLKEVLERRLAHIEWRLPDLIVVDGGVAQKNAVEKILKLNRVNTPVVSVVKDERHKPKEILGDHSISLTAGKKWSELEREILLANSEAHRFAIGYHKKIRGKIQ